MRERDERTGLRVVRRGEPRGDDHDRDRCKEGPCDPPS